MPGVVDKKKAVSKNSYRRAKKKAEKAKVCIASKKYGIFLTLTGT